MGKLYKQYLTPAPAAASPAASGPASTSSSSGSPSGSAPPSGSGILYRCSSCRAHLALHDSLVSKQFQGRHGRAYLFSHVVNVTLGPKEDRVLTTGLHSVSDSFCSVCGDNVGWFYHQAFEESQKYKEGKYIVEKEKMSKENLL